MSHLRENVKIITHGGELTGHLYVGEDGLPELEAPNPRYDPVYGGNPHLTYRPATFPAAWTMIMGDDAFQIGPLFEAWRDIEDVRQSIAEALREQETPHGSL